MAYLIKGNTANEIWQAARELVLEQGCVQNNTREVLHVVMELNHPRQKWVSNRNPAMSLAFAMAELVWIVMGDNKREVIDFWNKSYSKYTADEGKDYYHGAYGYRLRYNYDVDQLQRAYEALKANPDNRQTVMLYWDPRLDLPRETGAPQSRDIPCNICSMLKLRAGKLEWTQVMRSNDLYKGLPYNFVQFTSLQEILAGWLGVEVGTYTHISDSLHLYDQDEKCQYSTNELMLNGDSLSIPKDKFDGIIMEIYKRMQSIVYDNLTAGELVQTSKLESEYSAYNNLMCIIVAYAARKLGYNDIIPSIISSCSNMLYERLWMEYCKR